MPTSKTQWLRELKNDLAQGKLRARAAYNENMKSIAQAWKDSYQRLISEDKAAKAAALQALSRELEDVEAKYSMALSIGPPQN